MQGNVRNIKWNHHIIAWGLGLAQLDEEKEYF